MSTVLRPRGGAPPRILVIDDDEIALAAIHDLLVSAGYEVHTMMSPIGATQVIVSKQIQLAVVDLNMPIMRGDRFIALVRSWDKIRDLPIVLISGDSLTALEAVIAHLPGTQVVTKEDLRRELPDAIKRALAGQRKAWR